jgi:hypothetical protein
MERWPVLQRERELGGLAELTEGVMRGAGGTILIEGSRAWASRRCCRGRNGCWGSEVSAS